MGGSVDACRAVVEVFWMRVEQVQWYLEVVWSSSGGFLGDAGGRRRPRYRECVSALTPVSLYSVCNWGIMGKA